jgi:hypothetical protein
LGSEKKAFRVIFDTGSSWIWIGTEECDTCISKNLFETEDSITFIQNDSELESLEYITGKVEGYKFQD